MALLQPVAWRTDPIGVALLHVAVALLLLLAGVDAARAASSLRFAVPTRFGEFLAETLDPDGGPLGPARAAVARDPRGRVVLEGLRGIDQQESVGFYALLEPAGEADALRVVEQRTRAFDAQGELLVETVIDHASKQATCNYPDRLETIQLPEDDRVANVPISLLLAPIARGEVDEVAFQALICERGGPRLLDIEARRTGRSVRPAEGRLAVEIEYEVRLNPILARIARPFLPQIRIWVDPEDSGTSVAQHMPLYPRGPTILVVRRGLSPELFLGH